MNRDFIKLLLMLLAVLGALGVLWSCQGGSTFEAPWEHADTHAQDIGQKINAAATQVSGTAAEIVTTAREGRNATPEGIRPKLDPFWSRIIVSGQMLYMQSDALIAVRQDIDALRVQVQAGQQELVRTKSALEAEKSHRQKDNQDWQAKLDKANSQWESMFRTISWLAIVAIGVAVTVGVLMHDFRISVAGGAGGLAVVIACMIVGEIQHWLPWVAGGLIVVVALWILIETIFRGSLKEAIRTNPVQDLQDLLTKEAHT